MIDKFVAYRAEKKSTIYAIFEPCRWGLVSYETGDFTPGRRVPDGLQVVTSLGPDSIEQTELVVAELNRYAKSSDHDLTSVLGKLPAASSTAVDRFLRTYGIVARKEIIARSLKEWGAQSEDFDVEVKIQQDPNYAGEEPGVFRWSVSGTYKLNDEEEDSGAHEIFEMHGIILDHELTRYSLGDPTGTLDVFSSEDQRYHVLFKGDDWHPKVQAQLEGSGSFLEGTRTLVIQQAWLDPAWRGRGLGPMLIAKASRLTAGSDDILIATIPYASESEDESRESAELRKVEAVWASLGFEPYIGDKDIWIRSAYEFEETYAEFAQRVDRPAVFSSVEVR
ncbi:hypothetical protein [Nocardia brasiliensis]|uniref:hypothetical protein n=1 Tax=Nocardia brasiliensis TaxID=37326 RepID=UPI001894FDB0|nr:hypothetical protein [Nocardia brasiliensis]MBF6128450.1 hypothetical protein [Nocardia brasiliensis]